MGTTYKRILLKLSGEALKGDETGLYHYEAVDEICKAIDECCKMGVQVAVVVGAGNIWRGGRADRKMDRSLAPGPTTWECWEPPSTPCA